MDRLKQLKNQYCQDLPQKGKQLFFLVAMPRSGNTLFASIMNQNPNLVCTANSITLEIMKDLFLLKQTEVFNVLGQLQSIERIKKDIAIENKKKDDAKLEFDKNSIGQQG